MIYVLSLLFLTGIIFIVYLLRIIISPPLFISSRNLQGQTIVITGGCNGIGLETAKHLYNLNASVILGCRNHHLNKYKNLCQSFKKNQYSTDNDTDSLSPSQSCYMFELDLSSFSSVIHFSSNIYAINIPVNVLINNAGIRQNHFELTTTNHIEVHYQINYLSHFLLVQLLLPLLIESHYSSVHTTFPTTVRSVTPDTTDRSSSSSSSIPSRIIHVSSSAHFYGLIDKMIYQYNNSCNTSNCTADHNNHNNHNHINTTKHVNFNSSSNQSIQFSRVEGVYGDTKLMQVLFSYYLQHHVFNNITRLIDALDRVKEMWISVIGDHDMMSIAVYHSIHRAKALLIRHQIKLSHNSSSNDCNNSSCGNSNSCNNNDNYCNSNKNDCINRYNDNNDCDTDDSCNNKHDDCLPHTGSDSTSSSSSSSSDSTSSSSSSSSSDSTSSSSSSSSSDSTSSSSDFTSSSSSSSDSTSSSSSSSDSTSSSSSSYSTSSSSSSSDSTSSSLSSSSSSDSTSSSSSSDFTSSSSDFTSSSSSDSTSSSSSSDSTSSSSSSDSTSSSSSSSSSFAMPLRSISLHPGFVNSHMGHSDTRWLQTLVLLLRPLLSRSVEQGALTTVYAVVKSSSLISSLSSSLSSSSPLVSSSPSLISSLSSSLSSSPLVSSSSLISEVEDLKGGEYLDNCHLAESSITRSQSDQDYDETASWLWDTSIAFVTSGIDSFI